MRLTRREFIRSSACALSLSGLGAISQAVGSDLSRAKRRPNIVIILADDMGFSDIGCYGSEIATPNVDSLARDGLQFTQAYNTARCCPSRAALLTGLYPHQAGMGDMVSPRDKPSPEGSYQGYLNRHCVTIAEVLRETGYRTYMSGKWHVGEAPEYWPRKRGFDRYFGLISGASSYWGPRPEENRAMALDDDPYAPVGDSFYMTDAIADYAIRFLEDPSRRDEPFFLYVPFTAPHWPLHAWPQDIDKYRGRYDAGWDKLREERYARQLNLGVINPKWRLSPRDSEVPAWAGVANKDDWSLRMAVYAAMVDRLDQDIGRMLATLKKIGADDNTLVIFLSDNGGCSETVEGRKLSLPGKKPGERGSFVAYERPWGNASNTPFRLFKHWVHEGGIATPFIARWPNRITKHGTKTNQVVHITDLMATCVDLAGAKYPTTFQGNKITPLVGKSLTPIFDGKTRRPHDRLFWEHEGNRAIREGKWKLVATAEGEWELFDMDADRTELTNLVAQQPRRAAKLHDEWLAWAKECGVHLDSKKSTAAPLRATSGWRSFSDTETIVDSANAPWYHHFS